MSFLEKNEVIVVAREKTRSVRHGGRKEDRRHSIEEYEEIVRGVDFLESGVARYGPTVNVWAVVMRQVG